MKINKRRSGIRPKRRHTLHLPSIVDQCMTEPARRRVSEALTDRMRELQLTVTDLADKATLDPSTIRSVLRGDRWPRPDTRRHIEAALGWPADAFTRIASTSSLHNATCDELRAELDARCETGT